MPRKEEKDLGDVPIPAAPTRCESNEIVRNKRESSTHSESILSRVVDEEDQLPARLSKSKSGKKKKKQIKSRKQAGNSPPKSERGLAEMEDVVAREIVEKTILDTAKNSRKQAGELPPKSERGLAEMEDMVAREIVEKTILDTAKDSQKRVGDSPPKSERGLVEMENIVAREVVEKTVLDTKKGADGEIDFATELQAAAPPPLSSRPQVRAMHPGAVAIQGPSPTTSSDFTRGLESEIDARSGTAATQDESNPLSILNARVVDEELQPIPSSGPIVEAKPMEDNYSKVDPLELIRTNRKVQLIVGLVLLVVVGAIAGIVVAVMNADDDDGMEQEYLDEGEYLALQELLREDSLDALNNPDSPQSRAIDWLFVRSDYKQFSEKKVVQRYALATIYYSIGENVLSDYGDESWLTESDECSWYFTESDFGDPCDSDGVLQILSLRHIRLRDSLPSDIALLSNLKVIDLKENELTGTLPSSVQELTELHELLLHDNFMEGEVLDSILPLASLKVVDLGYNLFSGAIPATIGNMDNLYELILDVNPFSGPLPFSFGQLDKLIEFSAINCSLTEWIPTEVGDMLNLEYLELSWNIHITGTIPSELGKLDKLSVMSAADCSLEGTIPTEVGSMLNLEYLVLSWNMLTGMIPSELWNLENLSNVTLDGNDLSGIVPTPLCASAQFDCTEDGCVCCADDIVAGFGCVFVEETLIDEVLLEYDD